MIIAVILYIATFSIKSLLGMNPGPDFMPKVAAIMLFIVAFFIFLEGIGTSKLYVAPVETDEDKMYKKAGHKKVILSIIAIGFYVFSMKTLGFLISTLIYEFCQMIILTPYGKKKTYILYAVISIISAFFFYLAFTKILYLMLPSGLLRGII